MSPSTFGPVDLGENTVTLTVRDTSGNYGYAQVTVTVEANPTPVAPIANADTYAVDQDNELSVPGPGVLTNDVDANIDPLQAILIDSVSNGVLGLLSDGSFVYTPNTGFVGTDSFTYKASDGLFESEPATVDINVLPPGVPRAWGYNYYGGHR